jgi:hypothetical protein
VPHSLRGEVRLAVPTVRVTFTIWQRLRYAVFGLVLAVLALVGPDLLMYWSTPDPGPSVLGWWLGRIVCGVPMHMALAMWAFIFLGWAYMGQVEWEDHPRVRPTYCSTGRSAADCKKDGEGEPPHVSNRDRRDGGNRDARRRQRANRRSRGN